MFVYNIKKVCRDNKVSADPLFVSRCDRDVEVGVPYQVLQYCLHRPIIPSAVGGRKKVG